MITRSERWPRLPGLPEWGRALRMGILGAALAIGAGLFVPDQYTSVARILPMPKAAAPNLGALAALQSLGGFGLGGGSSPLEQALPEILRSRAVLDPVLDQTFTYHMRSWRFGTETIRQNTLEAVMAAPDRDVAVQRLLGLLDVQRDLKSGVLTVKVMLPSRDLAQQVNQALLAQMDVFLVQTRSERGRTTAEFMRARVQSTREELEAALSGFLQFATRNRGYALSTDPVVRVEGQKREYEVEYRKQVLLRLQQQVDAAILEEKDATPPVSMLDRPTYPIQKTRPSRAAWAVAAFLLGILGTLLWHRRREIWHPLSGEQA